MQKIIDRFNEPTPKFFRILRNVGLSLTGVSAALLTAPFVLPAAVVTIAGYVAVAGTILCTVSQTAVYRDE